NASESKSQCKQSRNPMCHCGSSRWISPAMIASHRRSGQLILRRSCTVMRKSCAQPREFSRDIPQFCVLAHDVHRAVTQHPGPQERTLASNAIKMLVEYNYETNKPISIVGLGHSR